ncbi:hypothetical protein TVAG_271830 [Trichomonas vaginalis G3]|uniref:Uncharacterized protein n=1 Tax=Trichomonas vaginalis (strain ATCC PRA-98 / G3) TaxID=412133 RepID=A2E5T0_TRIV3|nr:hypothetical protein TVAGG3_0257000 [Trichomonas vaginalis G3]EAY12000.1 hypothetical protein TVAG_271830 [Trichomonas vaginalis G3]KAI5524825.1 hypothetical protein TVAGG3_0257000 [Trichomonas vaginalis G3]|eukprot:XP_001324223.1 hypothetical protein [Trichomonas vaginalis G3]
MSDLDQIGVQRVRRSVRRVPNSVSAPIFNDNPLQGYPSMKEAYNSPNFQNGNQINYINGMLKMQSLYQLYPELMEKIDTVKQQHSEIQNELKAHEDKIEILERQMMIFFGKMDRYAQMAQRQDLSGPAMQNMQQNQFGMQQSYGFPGM